LNAAKVEEKNRDIRGDSGIANKMTRIAWAVFAEGVLFDPTKAFMVKASAQEKERKEKTIRNASRTARTQVSKRCFQRATAKTMHYDRVLDEPQSDRLCEVLLMAFDAGPVV